MYKGYAEDAISPSTDETGPLGLPITAPAARAISLNRQHMTQLITRAQFKPSLEISTDTSTCSCDGAVHHQQ